MISVVIPVYNEAGQLARNIAGITAVLRQHSPRYELILIDDGSADNTWDVMLALARANSHIVVLKLSRNFGKEAALCAGLRRATGDACLIMDADLQHPPELIPEMIRLWRDEGYEVVEGVKSHRGSETWLAKFMALSFYRLFKLFSGINLDHASDYKLLDRKVVNAWKQLRETDTFFRGMSAWLGYRRVELPFEVKARTDGTSKWSYLSRLRLALKSITSFSSAPLYITSALGVILLIIDLVLITQTLYMKFSGRALSGFTTLIILELGIGSFIMISLGIMGVYISKIYNEVKHRPRYIIAETYQKKTGAGQRKSGVYQRRSNVCPSKKDVETVFELHRP